MRGDEGAWDLEGGRICTGQLNLHCRLPHFPSNLHTVTILALACLRCAPQTCQDGGPRGSNAKGGLGHAKTHERHAYEMAYRRCTLTAPAYNAYEIPVYGRPAR